MSDDYDFALTREAREQLVLDLYRQGKTRRQIAQAARMSFTDIGELINREYGSKQQKNKMKPELSTFSQALKMFLGGAKPVSVSIKYGLDYNEVRKIYLEFLNLNRMNKLKQIYDEVGDNMKPLISLNYKMQENNFTVEQVADAIELVDSLSGLEEKRSALNNDVNALESKKQEIASSNSALTSQIELSNNELNFYSNECKKKFKELTALNSEINAKRTIIKDFDNDEGFIRIKQAAKTEAGLVLQNNYALLAGTVMAVLEALRIYPANQELILHLLTPTSEPYREAWTESHKLNLIKLSEIVQNDISEKISNEAIEQLKSMNESKPNNFHVHPHQ